MQLSDNHNFKNIASQRFFEFFHPRIKEGLIDADTFYGLFAPGYETNRTQFFSSIKSGKRSVTIEQILIAINRYNIDPSYFFGKSSIARDIPISYVEEEEIEYVSIGSKAVGEKIRELLNKHDVKPKDYAEQIGMSEGNFQKILRGDVRPYFDLVVRVCDDFGESLDQFRTRPLPKGHILTQLKAQENLIRAHEKRIKELESELQGKRASA